MDNAQWTQFQEFGVSRSMVEIGGPMISSMSPCTVKPNASMEKRSMRPPKDQALNCPRCHSTNTKFCYYNNYSLTQPRYFCKSCRRYWTEGGTLRNVPVGGGSRRHIKKPVSTPNNNQNPKIHDQGQDLNLGYGVPRFLELPKVEGRDVVSSSPSSSSTTTATHLSTSALNFMISENNMNHVDRGPYSLIPNYMAPNSTLDHHHHSHHQANYALFPPPVFSFQESKPSLAGFHGSGYVNPHETEEDINGALMFTLGASKQSEGGDNNDQDKGSHDNNSNGFWNGMLSGGGGGSW